MHYLIVYCSLQMSALGILRQIFLANEIPPLLPYDIPNLINIVSQFIIPNS